jgi:hypothetical protein
MSVRHIFKLENRVTDFDECYRVEDHCKLFYILIYEMPDSNL